MQNLRRTVAGGVCVCVGGGLNTLFMIGGGGGSRAAVRGHGSWLLEI